MSAGDPGLSALADPGRTCAVPAGGGTCPLRAEAVRGWQIGIIKEPQE